MAGVNDPVEASLAGLRELLARLPAVSVAPPDMLVAQQQRPGFWALLDEQFHRDLSRQRVLIVPCGAGHAAFAFARHQARHVLACDPSDALERAELLESVYDTGVEFRQGGWEALDPERDGRFEIVHSNGLLHQVSNPIGLLRQLRAMTASGGTLLIGSLLLDDPERSEHLRFVPEPDAEARFVPGRLAFRWMVEGAGFEVEAELDTIGQSAGSFLNQSAGRFPISHAYLRAAAC